MRKHWHLHISPTNCRYESRLFKETASVLSAFPSIEHMVLLGRWEKGLATREQLDDKRTIVRIRLVTSELPRYLRPFGLVFLELLIRIVWLYLPQRPTVVSSHSVLLLPIAALFKLVGAKLVYDAHELETERNGLKGIRKFLAKVIEASLIRSADSVIVVGGAIADWYSSRYKIRRPAVVLNCPGLATPAKSRRFAEMFGCPPDVRLFLYQGALFEGRGLDLLLRSFLELPRRDVRLVVMGYGPLVEDVVAATKRSDRIFYCPAVPPSEVLSYTASADFGISVLVFSNSCLSYYLSLPNKLFEYLMAGLPVVVSDAPEQKSLVKTFDIGSVVKTPTVESVWQAVDAVMAKDYAKLRERVSEVRKLYCWERQEEILKQEYAQLLPAYTE